jgi:hypothetical protein
MSTPALELADALMQSEVPDSMVDEAATVLRQQAAQIETLLGVRDAALDLTAQLSECLDSGKISSRAISAMMGTVAALARSFSSLPGVTSDRAHEKG